MKWTYIDGDDTHQILRTRVYGGWLVKTVTIKSWNTRVGDSYSADGWEEHSSEQVVSLTFLPDKKGEWLIIA